MFDLHILVSLSFKHKTELDLLKCGPNSWYFDVRQDGLNRSPSCNVCDSTCPVPVWLNGAVHNPLHSIRQKQVCFVQPVLTANPLPSCSQWTHSRHKLLKVLYHSNPHTFHDHDLTIKLEEKREEPIGLLTLWNVLTRLMSWLTDFMIYFMRANKLTLSFICVDHSSIPF